MQIQSPTGATYTVGKQVAETSSARIYLCTDDEGKQCLLKIALEESDNGALDREANVLQVMAEKAAELQEKYAEKMGEGKFLNYHFCFPELVATFVSPEQGERRVNILAFPNICKEVGELVPIAHLVSHDRVRVDPKTSAWILGKLLKFFVFTHSLGIQIGTGSVSGENILINRDQHFVAIFDWTDAVLGEAPLPEVIAREEIVLATEAVVLILGGDPATAEIPADEQLEDGSYAELLNRLIDGDYADAEEAHADFYRLIDTIWPEGGFHPFTTYDLERGDEERTEETE